MNKIMYALCAVTSFCMVQASGEYSKLLATLDTRLIEIVHKLSPTGTVCHVDSYNDRVIVGYKDGGIKFFRKHGLSYFKNAEGFHRAEVLCVHAKRNGDSISCAADGTLFYYDKFLDSFRSMTIKGEKTPIVCICDYPHNEDIFIAGYANGTIKFFNIKTQQVRTIFKEEEQTAPMKFLHCSLDDTVTVLYADGMVKQLSMQESDDTISTGQLPFAIKTAFLNWLNPTLIILVSSAGIHFFNLNTYAVESEPLIPVQANQELNI
jgi:WD40 repeat protein